MNTQTYSGSDHGVRGRDLFLRDSVLGNDNAATHGNGGLGRVMSRRRLQRGLLLLAQRQCHLLLLHYQTLLDRGQATLDHIEFAHHLALVLHDQILGVEDVLELVLDIQDYAALSPIRNTTRVRTEG